MEERGISVCDLIFMVKFRIYHIEGGIKGKSQLPSEGPDERIEPSRVTGSSRISRARGDGPTQRP